MNWQSIRRAVEAFDAEDDPNVPAYDPVHLGAVLVLTLLAVGALYWLLWTLLVYEGGLFSKIVPALQVLFKQKTLAQLGYRGPWDRGVFEGWAGNLGALVLCSVLVSAAYRLWHDASARARK